MIDTNTFYEAIMKEIAGEDFGYREIWQRITTHWYITNDIHIFAILAFSDDSFAIELTKTGIIHRFNFLDRNLDFNEVKEILHAASRTHN